MNTIALKLNQSIARGRRRYRCSIRVAVDSTEEVHALAA